jgi:TPR repeat protein
MMYESGLGVAPDQRRARDLFLKSAAQGYSPAMVNLGLMLTQKSNADTRGVVACGFGDQSNAPAAIMGTGQHLLLGIQ